MKRASSILALALLGSLCGCTAIAVVTHQVDDDPLQAPPGHYHLDPHHASLTFDVDHLGYSRFVMRFDRMTADLDFLPDQPTQSRVEAVIEAASFDSNVVELDQLVRGPDLLDAAHYPEIRFASRLLRRTGPHQGDMEGELTLHGETQKVTLAVTFNGGARNPLTGDDTLGFTAEGSLDRGRFGLARWFPAVGVTLHLVIQAEFVKPHEGSH